LIYNVYNFVQSENFSHFFSRARGSNYYQVEEWQLGLKSEASLYCG